MNNPNGTLISRLLTFLGIRSNKPKVIRVTRAAARQFKQALLTHSKRCIRVSIIEDQATGGFRYDLQFATVPEITDVVDNSYGFYLAIDKNSAVYLEGTTIDWKVEPDGRAGFKFHNPNAEES